MGIGKTGNSMHINDLQNSNRRQAAQCKPGKVCSPSHMDCTLALGKLPCACPSVGLECHRLNIARLAKDTEPREFHAPPGKRFGSLLESYTSLRKADKPATPIPRYLPTPKLVRPCPIIAEN